MNQIVMSVNEEKASWYYEIEEVFMLKLQRINSIVATKFQFQRMYIVISFENGNKREVEQIIRESLVEMYTTVVKKQYLINKIDMPALKKNYYNFLVHTLVAFDRETERDIILECLTIGEVMQLDGFFNFKLNELIKHWDEIANLATDNGTYLSNEKTFNELLRFLISAINPKINTLEITQTDSSFNVIGALQESRFELILKNSEQLMIYLIDVAPMEIRLNGEFSDKAFYNQLISIFDATPELNYFKSVNKKNFIKN